MRLEAPRRLAETIHGRIDGSPCVSFGPRNDVMFDADLDLPRAGAGSVLSNRVRKYAPLLILAVVLVAAGRQAKSVDWRQTWIALRQTNLAWFMLGAAIFYAGFLARCARWRLLLSNASFNRRTISAFPSNAGLAAIMFRAWSMNAVTIAQVGDGYRAYSFKRRTGAPAAPVLGTILAERIVDAVVLAGLMIPAVGIAFRRDLSADATWALIVAGALATLGPVVLKFLPEIATLVGRVLPGRGAAILADLSGGAARSLKRIPQLVALSALGWAGESTMLWLVARAAGTPIAPSSAATVALVTALLTTIPITPGGLGVAEAGIVMMLGQLGMAAGPAAAVAVLARAISFGSVVLGGGIVWAFAPRAESGRSVAAARADADALESSPARARS